MQKYNKYEHIVFNTIFRSKSPIIIATDGSLKNIDTDKNSAQKISNSAFTTMGILNIKEGESITSGEWTTRPITPLLFRISALPNQLGDSDIDISIAECHAFLMEELYLPIYFPRILITDSEAVRDQVLYARDKFNGDVNRKFIRSNIGGISKCVMGNLAKLINDNSRQIEISTSIKNNPPLQSIIRTLRERNIEFLKVAKNWTNQHITQETDMASETTSQSILLQNNLDVNNQNSWRHDYFVEDDLRPIFKVNSHQLDDTGCFIRDAPRYEKLIPIFCLLHANHIADTIGKRNTIAT